MLASGEGWAGRTESQASLMEQIGASPASGVRIIFRGWTLQDGEFGEGRGSTWGILRHSGVLEPAFVGLVCQDPSSLRMGPPNSSPDP